jgi:transposase
MSQPNDLSRSLTSLEQDSTIIAVIEMSQSSWLVAGIVPGIERHPLKKIEPSEEELICLLMRWRAEATKHGRTITRIAVAFEAGRDGFWLARWLRARDIEIYVIHPTSVAVSREHRRAKTDRLDTGLLKRVFIGWLRGEPDHCHMAAIPTLAEEDAKRPNRQRERLVRERTRIVNRMKSCLVRFGVRNFKPTLRKAPEQLETLHTPEGVAKRAQETGGVLCHESGPATLLVRGKPRSMPGGLPETRWRVDRSGRALVAPTKAKEPSRSVNATALNRTF